MVWPDGVTTTCHSKLERSERQWLLHIRSTHPVLLKEMKAQEEDRVLPKAQGLQGQAGLQKESPACFLIVVYISKLEEHLPDPLLTHFHRICSLTHINKIVPPLTL